MSSKRKAVAKALDSSNKGEAFIKDPEAPAAAASKLIQYTVSIKADAWSLKYRGRGIRYLLGDELVQKGPFVVKIKTLAKPNTPRFVQLIHEALYETYGNLHPSTQLVFLKPGQQPTNEIVNIQKARQFQTYAVKINGNPLEIKQLRLRDSDAPFISRFGKNLWNQTFGQCVADYLTCKYSNRKLTAEQIETALGNPTDEGVLLDTLLDTLQEFNISYYCVGPDGILYDKFRATRTERETAYFFVQNSHIYPIECANLRNTIAKCEIGDQAIDLYINKKLISFSDAIAVEDLTDSVISRFKNENVLPDKINTRDNSVVLAQYGNTIYYENHNVEIIKEFIEQINQFIDSPIEFSNQTIQAISIEIIQALGFKIPKDAHCDLAQGLLQNRAITLPPCLFVDEEFETLAKTDQLEALDIKRCHYQIMTNINTLGMPIFSLYDEIKPFDNKPITPGLYYVDEECFALGGEAIPIGRKWIDGNLLQYCFDRGYLTKGCVSFQYRASASVGIDVFQKLDTIVNKTQLADSFKKHLWNNLAGLFASHVSTTSQAFVSNSKEVLDCFDGATRFAIDDNLYIIDKTRLVEKACNYGIYYSIICSEYICLDMLICMDTLQPAQPVQLYKIKTDAIYFLKGEGFPLQNPGIPDKITFEGSNGVIEIIPREEEVSLGVSKPKALTYDESYYTMPEREPRPVYDSIPATHGVLKGNPLILESFSLTGPAGSGKTWTVINKIYPQIKDTKYVFTAVSHKACLNYTKLGYNTQVAFSLFESVFENPINILRKFDWVIVDEISMFSTEYFKIIHEASKLGVRFVLIGDFNQIPAIESSPRIHSDYSMFEDICKFHVKLSFNSLSRYDIALYSELSQFLTTGKLSESFRNQITTDLDANSQYFAWTRAECARLNKQLAELAEEQDLPLRYIAEDNVLNMINNEIFVLQKGATPILKSVDRPGFSVNFTKVSKKVGLAFCITVHRAQGMTCQGPVVISQAKLMSKNLLYTAISRATSLENVKFIGKPLAEYPADDAAYECKTINTKAEKTGYIYNVVDAGKVVYIGQTIDPERRKAEHLENFPKAKFKIVRTILYSTLKELLQVEYRAVLDHVKENPTHCLKNRTLVKRAEMELEELQITSADLAPLAREYPAPSIKTNKTHHCVVWYVAGIYNVKKIKIGKDPAASLQKATAFLASLAGDTF